MSEKSQHSDQWRYSTFRVTAGAPAAALLAITIGIWNLDVGAWEGAILALGSLFMTTSTFTLAKCVRDAQESAAVVERLHAAGVERILADHHPFKAVG